VPLLHKSVAAASIFVASKSEECGRRLKDVAMVCMTKASSVGMFVPEDVLPELDKWQATILKTEDILLEALGFDLVVQHPHAILSEIFAGHSLPNIQDAIEDLSWSIATDSFRTPACVLFDPSTLACACLVLAILIAEEQLYKDLDRLMDSIEAVDMQSDIGQAPASANLLKESSVRYNASVSEIKSAIIVLLQFYRRLWLPSSALAPGQDHFLAPIVNIPLPNGVMEGFDLFAIESSYSTNRNSAI